MKNKIQIMASFAFLLTAQPVMADDTGSSSDRPASVHHSIMVQKYESIEAEALRISLDDSLNGFVEGKVCDACEEVHVIITPETKAYEKRAEVPLIKAKARIGRFATVMYDKETKKVATIRW